MYIRALLGCGDIYLSSIPLFLSMKLTSSAVIGPCSFCPFNISASNSRIDLPLLTKASDTLRLRPPASIKITKLNQYRKLKLFFELQIPQHVVIKSATPQLSKNVDNLLPGQKTSTNLIISIRPKRMTAAFVLSPRPKPSTKPAPHATMFCEIRKLS